MGETRGTSQNGLIETEMATNPDGPLWAQEWGKPGRCTYSMLVSMCGRTYTYRERQYGERPKDWKERHKYTQFACQRHFI